ncbi:MAG: exonuclease SbcCD subunit D [Anaerolineales bacterium]|nr:exonuclease SbcCD subunit D [Anaerolineales bacterium]MCS7248207.1 exonuclease SbcCD subunit D [Anaerolineales bacterium]MDW8162020.1 exonuclease SbcCD subunit D [Anaerolineales bacterium]MDW8448057.1 exonuclease SbcCD subunit D [Anaerolineales bacterium]
MVKILHFADAHIDLANFGRQDPQTNLPLRVLDFLHSLDEIVETAIEERVELVLFAGDAYKDRNPAPTFQREWGRRIMRLSRAQIPTLLVVGNHDMSPALGRAHALEAFETLEVPYVRVVDQPMLLRPEDLGGVPLQVIALPWLSRSRLIAHLSLSPAEVRKIDEAVDQRLRVLLEEWLQTLDPTLPTVLTAHATVQGARYGAERSWMLGNDLVLSLDLLRDARLDYVALGHIHLAQDLNAGSHPPIVYPGSIERVDFSEARDEKFFVIAAVERGNTEVCWRKLTKIRPFFDLYCRIEDPATAMQKVFDVLPPPERLRNAIVRLVVEYPADHGMGIDEPALRRWMAEAFEFHLVRRPLYPGRARLPDHLPITHLGPKDLLKLYLQATHNRPEEIEALLSLAEEVFSAEPEGEG